MNVCIFVAVCIKGLCHGDAFSGPADTWSQMNQAHDSDTNSVSSSVLFAKFCATTHLISCQMKLTRRLNLYLNRVPGSFDSRCQQAVRLRPDGA